MKGKGILFCPTMYWKDKLVNRHEAFRLFNDKQHAKDPVIKGITSKKSLSIMH